MYADMMKNLPQDTINAVWPKDTLEEVDLLKNQVADKMSRNPMRQQFLNRISTDSFMQSITSAEKKYLVERFGEPAAWTWETVMKEPRLSDPKAVSTLNDFYNFVFIQEIKKRAFDFVPWIPRVNKIHNRVNRQPSAALKQTEEEKHSVSAETKRFVNVLKGLRA
jgi:hypothetical protein